MISSSSQTSVSLLVAYMCISTANKQVNLHTETISMHDIPGSF